MDTKLTVRVPRHALEKAKRYARENHTTITELISSFLEQIPLESDLLKNAPFVRQITGLLSQGTSIDDYKKHLEEKYGKG